MTKHGTITLDDRNLPVHGGIVATMEQSREDSGSMPLREWLAGQAEFAAHVRARIADADAGGVVSHEEVERIALRYVVAP